MRAISNKYQLSPMNPHDVLQTNKVDAQCDKLVTKLSWQRLRQSTRSSYSELLVESRQFNLPHPHLALPLMVTPFEFCRDIRRQKTRDPALSCGIVCVILCLAISVEHRLVTDDHSIYRTSMASRSKEVFHKYLNCLEYRHKFPLNSF